ncbi:hypothetical protein DFH08DRAFT_961688 [Mycena albidolilacea]|uniref:Uncharacterized protein n=1 Tax=Mycena albidolilacea TaxID=1033008 RepID=A0AAD6ZYW3_9AGAR|nr:hypothetical protein DFH08DRAFT_961688 [Mycena albidolilacea]
MCKVNVIVLVKFSWSRRLARLLTAAARHCCSCHRRLLRHPPVRRRPTRKIFRTELRGPGLPGSLVVELGFLGVGKEEDMEERTYTTPAAPRCIGGAFHIDSSFLIASTRPPFPHASSCLSFSPARSARSKSSLPRLSLRGSVYAAPGGREDERVEKEKAGTRRMEMEKKRSWARGEMRWNLAGRTFSAALLLSETSLSLYNIRSSSFLPDPSLLLLPFPPRPLIFLLLLFFLSPTFITLEFSTRLCFAPAVHINSPAVAPYVLCRPPTTRAPSFRSNLHPHAHSLPTWPGADDKDKMGLDSISDPEEDKDALGLDHEDVSNAFPACGLGISGTIDVMLYHMRPQWIFSTVKSRALMLVCER